MATSQLYPQRGRFSITPEGHEDLVSAETCECVQVVEAGLIVCHECGTVYGLLRQSSFASARSQWRAGTGS